MNFLKSLLAILLFVGLTITSCKKDEIVNTDTNTPSIKPTHTQVNGLLDRSGANSDGLELGCVNIPYPFGLVFADSSQLIINSESDFLTALGDSIEFAIDFVYPLNVTDADGNPAIVNSIDELGALFADCVPTTGWNDTFPDWFFPAWDLSLDNSCYELVYPLTLLNEDGTNTVAADHDELVALLSDGTIYSFGFPLNLKDENGTPIVASDANALFNLLASCGGSNPGGCGIGSYGCFTIGYPATLTLIDGSAVVVNNDDEFGTAVMNGDWAGFAYPLTLINEDGTQVIVQSEQEFNDAILSCYGGNGDPGFGGDLACYNLTFPVTIIDPSIGLTIEITNQTGWQNVMAQGISGTFVYPIILTEVGSGTSITINNDLELTNAVQDCW